MNDRILCRVHASEPFLHEMFYRQMRCGLRFFAAQQAFDVFREKFGFDVDGVVDGHGVDVGMRVGEGDYGDVGEAVVPAGDGEADAVEGDGTFFGDVAAEILRDPDGEPPIFAFGCDAGDAADAVNMTLHEMSAQARAGCQRAFEVYQVAGFFFCEIGAAESFAGEVGGEMRCVEFDYCQAAAVYGDAVA